MKSFVPLNIIVLLVVFAVACSNDEYIVEEVEPIDYSEECLNLSDLGVHTILEQSKTFIPYEDDIKRIIFIDSIANEIIGSVKYYEEIIQGTTISGIESDCPLDPKITIRYNYKPVIRRISIEIEEIDVSISISLHPSLTPLHLEDRYISDVCYIFLNTPIGGGGDSGMSIVVDRRTNPMPLENYSEFKTQLEIGNRIFEDVYINSIDEEDNYEILYNEHQGLIGIRKMTEPKVNLFFDRVEN